MELRQVQYFLAVAKHESFTRAADHVCVSQPSLSVQIGALEEELGTKLFDRLGRKVALTQAGELFRQHAERALHDLEQAAHVMQELQGAKRGRLSVGTLSTVNSYLIAPLVSRFKQRFPEIHLQIHAQPSTDIVNGILANQLDLGICLLPLAHPQLHTTALFEERLVLVAPASTKSLKPRLRMQDLATLPLILMPIDYCLRKMVEGQCAKAGVHPQVSLEMSSPEGILQAVSEGAGMTILPELYVRLRLPYGSLQVVDIYDPTPRHPVGLAFLKHRHQNLAASEFANLCRTTMNELLSELKRPPVVKGRSTSKSLRRATRAT
jgi:LysR family cyn operon transcriptional activator